MRKIWIQSYRHMSCFTPEEDNEKRKLNQPSRSNLERQNSCQKTDQAKLYFYLFCVCAGRGGGGGAGGGVGGQGRGEGIFHTSGVSAEGTLISASAPLEE